MIKNKKHHTKKLTHPILAGAINFDYDFIDDMMELMYKENPLKCELYEQLLYNVFIRYFTFSKNDIYDADRLRSLFPSSWKFMKKLDENKKAIISYDFHGCIDKSIVNLTDEEVAEVEADLKTSRIAMKLGVSNDPNEAFIFVCGADSNELKVDVCHKAEQLLSWLSGEDVNDYYDFSAFDLDESSSIKYNDISVSKFDEYVDMFIDYIRRRYENKAVHRCCARIIINSFSKRQDFASFDEYLDSVSEDLVKERKYIVVDDLDKLLDEDVFKILTMIGFIAVGLKAFKMRVLEKIGE